MSTTTRPFGPSSVCHFCMMGIILRQGAHLRKPNSSQTTLPLSAPSLSPSGALSHWSLVATISGGALPRYECPNLLSWEATQARTAAARKTLTMSDSLLQLGDHLEDGLAVLGGVDLGVLVGDLAGLVDDEGPAHLGDAPGELLVLVVDLLLHGAALLGLDAEGLGDVALVVG